MTERFKNLLNKIKVYQSIENVTLIEKAFVFAQKAHEGQKRINGKDFIVHPLGVAEILVSWHLDAGSIMAGLLHDVVEDGGVTLERLGKEFGKDITQLVNGVTKIGEIKLRGTDDDIFVENLRKMIVVMAHDLRVILVKLADRYHNLKTLYVLPLEKQKRIAKETLEVYAPLAERLGMGEIKGQLEDMAFPYAEPEKYKHLKKQTASYYKQASEDIKDFKREVLKNLVTKGIKAQVNGRQKHLYSLFKKLYRPKVNKDINKIYDLMALRIIVNTIEECYIALGLIHNLYKPVPSVGVRDFIAQPKPNGYQSIHTNVFARGRIIEIQIRTRKMHEEAENGIAAHWYYAQQKMKKVDNPQIKVGFFAPTEKMSWVNELVQWQKEIVGSKEFLDSLKFDALNHRIFVFSPKGDVYDLPADATPVDFAYAVHSDLGDQCAGAKVDGRMVGLDFKLKSGQVVEILTDKNKKKPSTDWLNFVMTQQARRKIAKHIHSS
ncbi:MAG: RelA/SpoT family protein [Candidatus Shapirobacteria bacterium]|nr:RelA/SpoT family protein [Candidatus Shapirobacteria bacterium]